MKLIVSFVHGYNNLKLNSINIKRPSLIVFQNNDKKIYKFYFSRTTKDFNNIDYIGYLPIKNSKEFSKMPRFGFTRLAENKKSIFCGSWNFAGTIKFAKDFDYHISINLLQ